ncbi:hypothetical protein CTAYLR_000612 [Chrysophaeum taylorii]|uniref:PH domain-containing protein n=1 Tax=Chrysophaeum taylorii TaxID=2483200 RepID=A0AAD7UJ45_9STRA|nr:hypothetical protein CTAYLR_000612 [Chrysophaeum taylorii]
MADEIVHIHGYLHKLTKEGTWQKRWFETNGCFLTYYKSKRMTKLLAALSLPQVGDIKLVVDSQDEGLFSITLHQRTYMLKAPTKADAERWVQTLLLLKNQPAEAPAAAASKPAEEAEWSKSQPRFCCCCRR